MKKIIDILNQYRQKKAIYQFIVEIILLFFISIVLFIFIVSFESIFYIEVYLRSKIILFYISVIAITTSYFFLKYIITYYALLNYQNHYLIAKELGEKFLSIKDQLLNVLQINSLYEKTNNDLKQIATENIYHKINKLSKSNFNLHFPKYLPKVFILMIISLLLFIFSSKYKDASYRLINYNKNFSPPYPFILTTLTDDITALSGDTISISIAGTGDIPDSIDFYWIENNKKNQKKIHHEKEFYSNDFNNIKSEIIYWAEFQSNKFFSPWDIISTNKDTLKIKARPKLKNIEFKITPPIYTNLKPSIESLNNINQINIIKGSKVSIIGETDKNLSSSWILNKYNNERINLTVKDNFFSKDILMDNDFLFSIYYLDDKFIPNLNPKQYYFICEYDAAPSINIQSPSVEFNIDETMIIPIISNIIDDFGLSQIYIEYEIISEDFPSLNKSLSTYMISDSLNEKSYNLDINWDIKNLPISMGDELHFRISAIDNNKIDGKQKSTSNTLIGKFPSLENLFLEIEQIEDDTIDILDEIESSIEEISDFTEDIKRDLLKSDEATWDQKEKLENSFEEIDEISSKIQEIQENINNILEKADNNQLFDNELIDKFEKFQELISNIMSNELLESIEKLQEALKNLDMDDITKALENFDFNVEQFEQQLDRYIEMFETAMAEQKINELSEHMENMIDKQIDFIDDVNNNQDDYVLERKSAKQEKRFSEFKELLDEASNMINDNSPQISEQIDNLSNDLITTDTQNLLDQQTQNTKNQANNNQVKNNLDDIQNMVNEIKDNFQNQISAELTKEFIRIIDNLITISNQQENLILQSKYLRSNSPNIQKINKNQFNIDRQFNQITKQLIDLSNATFFVNPKINRLIGKLKSTISNVISNFEQKNISKAKIGQEESLKHINEITYLLLLSMEEMQSSNAASGFEKFMESLGEMSEAQDGVNQQTMQLGSMGMMQQQAIMQQLMQQQAQLKQQLSDLISDNPGQETGGLSKAEQEMEEVLKDLQLNNVNTKTIERQQSILSKMLDSQKSLKQRDFSNKRNSKTATTQFENIDYDNIPQNYGEKDLFYISAMENALKENPDNNYDNMIRLYFLNLQKESIENEN